MANNRMYLVHRPSGKCVAIAKQLGIGWSVGPTAEDMTHLGQKLNEMFDAVETAGVGLSDFMLALESNVDDEAPMCGKIAGYRFDDPSGIKKSED